MPVTITIRGRLKTNPSTSRAYHDEVTAATQEMARASGDISHQVRLNPRDEQDFLGIDVWESPQQAEAFAGSPQIQEFFGRLFEAPPEVTAWVDPGWNQW